MKERPILFSAPMVRALLAGTKTQTRRAMKPQPWAQPEAADDGRWQLFEGDVGREPFLCPYGQPGDRLWVRETHSIGPGPDVVLWPGEDCGTLQWPHVTYAADGAVEKRGPRWTGAFGRGRPSIHMPRWACRITLEITGVRVQRLRDISDDDALAEGIDTESDDYAEGESLQSAGSPVSPERYAFATLWRSINGAGSWDANPWVWVVEFKRMTAHEGREP